jgi:tRNA A-37 threonylcarbamoyl transferase component Bud32
MAETVSRWNSTFLSRIIRAGSSSNPTEFGKLIATIKGIHDLIDPGVQLNRQLCGYVDRKLSKLKASLESRYKSFVRAPESVPNDAKIVLNELYLVVKRVEVLVQKCTFIEARDQWLEVAITMANVEEHVVEMELDLAWWVSVLKVAADSNMGEPELLGKVESAMRKQETLLEKLSKELSSLQKAAKTDREDLLSRLEEVKKKGNTNSRQYVLAICLLSRMQEGHDQIAPEVAVQLQPKNKGEFLGRGAYGEVHAVTWLGNQECACKGFKHQELDHEYRILRRCSHPHILQSLWYWKEKEKSHIIMQRMPENLDTFLSREKLDLHVAIDVMLQIAKAMRYLQQNKIVHRDLKPSNVLVQPENFGESSYIHVKLGDFGTAKNYLNSETFSEQTPNLGTKWYAAPEVIFGKQMPQPDGTPKFPPKADVWSFSMVCYQVLSGKRPFHQESKIGTFHAKIQDPKLRPLFPQDCPDYISTCISRCWEQSPDKRPTFSDICTRLKLAKAFSLGITCLQPCMHILSHEQPDNQGTR